MPERFQSRPEFLDGDGAPPLRRSDPRKELGALAKVAELQLLRKIGHKL
jgi:hypothetical protein